jgi:outer membrane protein assembly factor BamB
MRTLLILTIISLPSFAGDWPQFRGGNAGRVAEVSHPLEWDATKNVAWAVPMVGSGWSSPVVVNGKIYLTTAVAADGSRPKGMMAGVASMGTYRNAKPSEHEFIVRCLSLDDGSELWSRSVKKMVPPVVHPSNTYATESPASDGERLFTFFATTGTLLGWDLDGNELWRKELGTFKSGNGFGTGSSLALADGLVFVQFDNDENSFVAAYRATDGEQVWRDDRATRTSWSTPLIWDTGERRELVTCGSGIVTSYNPADGEVLWQLDGIQSSFSASPSIGDNRIYFGNSGPMSAGPLVAVAAGTTGEIQLDSNFESSAVAWSRTKSGPGMASPVVSNSCLFIPGSGGILNCYDTRTGERVYRTRVPKMDTVAASLWADETHVFILDESGHTFVIEAGPEFKLVATNTIDDLFWSTPAVAGDTLLLRGVDKLYCIRN